MTGETDLVGIWSTGIGEHLSGDGQGSSSNDRHDHAGFLGSGWLQDADTATTGTFGTAHLFGGEPESLSQTPAQGMFGGQYPETGELRFEGYGAFPETGSYGLADRDPRPAGFPEEPADEPFAEGTSSAAFGSPTFERSASETSEPETGEPETSEPETGEPEASPARRPLVRWLALGGAALVLATGLAGGVLFLSQREEQPKRAEAPITLHDAKTGISVTLPPGWRAEPGTPDTDAYRNKRPCPDNARETCFDGAVTVFFTTAQNIDEAAGSFRATLEKLAKDNKSSLRLVKQDSSPVGGHPARSLRFAEQSGQQNSHTQVTVIELGAQSKVIRQFAVIHLRTLDSAVPAPVIDQILRSVTVDRPSPSPTSSPSPSASPGSASPSPRASST